MKNLIAAFLVSVSAISINPKAIAEDLQEAMLSQSDAEARKAVVSDVRYDLSLNLKEKQLNFNGVMKISFNFLKSKATSALRIDFDRGTVTKAMINGIAADPKVLDSGNTGYLNVPLHLLAEGANLITLDYTHAYSTIGKGLYRFVDQEDQQEYIYTDLEPYGANQVMPCFDQPDLKAVFKLSVEAPAHWQIIGNGADESTLFVRGRQIMTFQPTAPISTYIFAVLGGPYQVWKGQYKDIPLRLFARKSIAKFVGIDEWMDVTKKGLAFFEEFFQFPYPFKKYDQILVPDFGPGAMENLGAVTFNEIYYIFRSPATTKQRMVLAETILHEMAHMWFGDLVTMKWWNNLWLNESFATYMATLAVKTLPAFDPNAVDVYFFSSIKKWAYFEDGLRTTHPIEVNIPNTSEALANFDGITYGKGGSTLKQLHYLLGDENFKKGIRAYFQKHQYQNTELKDFIGALAEASGMDLQSWQEQWLQTKGTNTVKATWTCDVGKLQTITLEQGDAANADAIARSHKAELGFYYFKDIAGSATSELNAAQVMPVTYSGRTQTYSAKGLARQDCPSFIYPNEGDHDFAKAIFDLETVKQLKPYISRFKDSLSRQLVWYSLWAQVEAGLLPAREYLDIALLHLPKEKDLQTVEEVVNNLLGERYQDLSISKILKPEDRLSVYDRLWILAKSKLDQQVAGSSDQTAWLKIALRSTRSPESVNWTREVLNGRITIPGQAIEFDLRWDFMEALGQAGELSQEMIQKELNLDPSDTNSDRALRALGTVNEPKLNETLFKLFQGSTVADASSVSPLLVADLKSSRLQQGMKKYFSLLNEDKVDAVVESYFKNTAAMPRTLGENFMWDYGYALYPSTCKDDIMLMREEFFAIAGDLFPVVAKEARNAREVELRCIQARKLEYLNP